MKKAKRNIKLFEQKGITPVASNEVHRVRHYEMLKAYELGKYKIRPRETVLGAPLNSAEIRDLLKPCIPSNRQVNLGGSFFLLNPFFIWIFWAIFLIVQL